MRDRLWGSGRGLPWGVLVSLLWPGVLLAADLPLRGEIRYRTGEVITVERVEAQALPCRRGPFLFEVPLQALRAVQVDPTADQLKLLLQNGESCQGPIPKEPFRGEWPLGPIVKPWGLIERIEWRASPGGGGPVGPSAKKFSATLVGEGDLSVEALGDLSVEGAFTLWDPVKQRHELGLLPLRREDLIYLIRVSSVREVVRKGKVHSVVTAAGEEYEGELGEGLLRGDSSFGPFKIPLRDLHRIKPASPVPPEKASPSAQRTTLELASGRQVKTGELSLFYERYLLQGWTETGGSWTGGFTKPFLFVRVGGTREKASFSKLSRLELPEGGKGQASFRSRSGEVFHLPIDWEYHTGFEDLSGEGRYYNPGGYALRRLGFLGLLAPGVFVYFPLESVRVVSFEGA